MPIMPCCKSSIPPVLKVLVSSGEQSRAFVAFFVYFDCLYFFLVLTSIMCACFLTGNEYNQQTCIYLAFMLLDRKFP